MVIRKTDHTNHFQLVVYIYLARLQKLFIIYGWASPISFFGDQKWLKSNHSVDLKLDVNTYWISRQKWKMFGALA